MAHCGQEEEGGWSLGPKLERTSTTGRESILVGQGGDSRMLSTKREFWKACRDSQHAGGCSDPPLPSKLHHLHRGCTWPASCLTLSCHRGIHEGPGGIGLHLLHLVLQQVHQDGDDVMLPHLVLALQRDARPEREQLCGFTFARGGEQGPGPPQGTPERLVLGLSLEVQA